LVTNNGRSAGAIPPAYLRDPRLAGSNVGDKIIDINAIAIPSFGQSGPYQPPYYLRSPNRTNFDVSFVKNFNLSDDGGRRLQFRTGFFNIFNQAYPNPDLGDIDLALTAVCNVRRDGVPNGTGGTSDSVCDPTQGFSFTEDTLRNFGRIKSKHGRRLVEFVLKLHF
jgi:hypothetical protein